LRASIATYSASVIPPVPALMFDARRKLRTALVDAGYLPAQQIA
jgi:hypothetical protein